MIREESVVVDIVKFVFGRVRVILDRFGDDGGIEVEEVV